MHKDAVQLSQWQITNCWQGGVAASHYNLTLKHNMLFAEHLALFLGKESAGVWFCYGKKKPITK